MDKIVVLGGGIAGISAAYHLVMEGVDVACYEKNSYAGGLVSNFNVHGFRFDRAIHLSFSSDDYVRNLFKNTSHYLHAPVSFCYEDGKWLRHPIQNNLYNLSVEDRVKLISSYFHAPSEHENNYMSWLISQYGDAIAKRYMIKYTLKYWGIDASGLSLSWIGNRIRKADVSEILRGAFELRDDNHYYADEMRYPRKGGYVSFIKPMLERVNVSLNKKAILVSLKNKLIQFHDGETVVYDRLINTMPLPELIKIIDDVPSSIKSAADSLLYTKINLISVGFSKLINNKYLWFYMYSDTLAARAHSPSLKSSDSAPDGCSSLQFEIYHLSTSEQVSVDDMKADVKKYLINSEICQEGDILFLHHEYIEYGNIVYDHGMEERREIVLNYLKENSIFTAGRFGEWSYLWSDQALISGKLAASNILAELDCC